MKIHPVLAGICNAVLPGLGYLIISERRVFGWLMLAGSIACVILSFVEPAFISRTFFISTTGIGKSIESIWYLCFIAAYAYDAWSLAKDKLLIEDLIASTGSEDSVPGASDIAQLEEAIAANSQAS